MELFIQLRDGVPVEHPIFGDNFRDAFPDIDTKNLPPQFARFERLLPPDATTLGEFETYDTSYAWFGKGKRRCVRDVFTKRPMNEMERAQKAADISAHWTNMLAQMIPAAQATAERYDGEVKEMWLHYAKALEDAEVTDPLSFMPPPAPRRDDQGKWSYVTDSGSAPDVIG